MAEEKEMAPQNLLSHYNLQRDWKPTKPRGPVMASLRSPGPAIVCLPTTVGEKKHDPTRTKAPGHFIAIKTKIFDESIGPGPGKYNTRGWTQKGKERVCAPYMTFRHKEDDKFKTPGPDVYRREDCDERVFPSHPKYTIGLKGLEFKKLNTPGANAYRIPPILGNPNPPLHKHQPRYDIGLKLGGALSDLNKSPGPAAYVAPHVTVYKDRPPAYTMASKAVPPFDAMKKPGPQDYQAEKVKVHKYSAPKYTFGIKHSPYAAFPGFAEEK